MGRTITPKYALEMTGFAAYGATPFAWKGRIPTVAQLEKVVMEHVVSTYPGYVNEQIGKTFGISLPSRAVVKENFAGGRVMVEWKAAPFQVLPNAADYPNVAKTSSFGAAGTNRTCE